MPAENVSHNRTVLEENVKLHRIEANFYDLKCNFFEQHQIRREIELITCYARSMNLNFRAIDVGSGSGNISRHLIKMGWQVVAVDLSRDMLKHNTAQHRVICDAANLPFNSDCFSLLTTHAVFHHMPNLKKFLAEIIRVTALIGLQYHDDNFLPNRTIPSSFYKEIGRFLYFLTNIRNKDYLQQISFYIKNRTELRKLMNKIDRNLTDGNPVPIKSILEIYDERGLSTQVIGYRYNSIFRAFRLSIDRS